MLTFLNIDIPVTANEANAPYPDKFPIVVIPEANLLFALSYSSSDF